MKVKDFYEHIFNGESYEVVFLRYEEDLITGDDFLVTYSYSELNEELKNLSIMSMDLFYNVRVVDGNIQTYVKLRVWIL